VVVVAIELLVLGPLRLAEYIGNHVSIPLTWSRRRNEGAILKGGPERTLADSGTAGRSCRESFRQDRVSQEGRSLVNGAVTMWLI
jgi:hypothetical protein